MARKGLRSVTIRNETSMQFWKNIRSYENQFWVTVGRVYLEIQTRVNTFNVSIYGLVCTGCVLCVVRRRRGRD